MLYVGSAVAPSPVIAAAWPQIGLGTAIAGFSRPVHIANAGDGSGRLFIIEQGGLIRIAKHGVVEPTPFLDLSGRVSCCGERGLLSIAFPPDYGRKGRFYAYYTDRNGTIVVARYTLTTPDIADAGSEQIVLTIAHPTYGNHNGGQLAFGPRDGYLYVGTGDGGGAGDPNRNGQNPGVLLGKLLRLDVEAAGTATYVVPATNPFTAQAGARPELWALGLRNPWRFAFDRVSGDLFIADVGQSACEEINVELAGGSGGHNFGWNIMEGFHCYDAANCDQTGLTLPVTAYAHAQGDCSVTGGHVYRGSQFSALQGVYIYGDYCSGRIRGLRSASGAWESAVLYDTTFRISAFGEDEAGEIYVVDYGGSSITHLVEAPGATPTTTPTMPPTETPPPTHTPVVTGTPTSTTSATVPAPTPTPILACTGDCDENGTVTISELLTMTRMALGSTDISSCGGSDLDGNGQITIDEIVTAVHNALAGSPPCHGRSSTPGASGIASSNRTSPRSEGGLHAQAPKHTWRE